MVLVLDDLPLFPFSFVGIEPVPNLLGMVLRGLHRHALEEFYPLGKIQDQVKEVRMEFELGEISREEYEKRNALLLQRLETARKVREIGFEARADLLGG